MPRPLSDYAFCKTFIHTDSGHKSSRRRLDTPLECRVISFFTSISYAVGPSFRHPSFTTQISCPAKTSICHRNHLITVATLCDFQIANMFFGNKPIEGRLQTCSFRNQPIKGRFLVGPQWAMGQEVGRGG